MKLSVKRLYRINLKGVCLLVRQPGDSTPLRNEQTHIVQEGLSELDATGFEGFTSLLFDFLCWRERFCIVRIAEKNFLGTNL